MKTISDATLLMVTDNACKMSKPQYEELLVNIGLYSLEEFEDPDGWYYKLGKRELIKTILQELNGSDDSTKVTSVLNALHKEKRLSSETLSALAMDGIEFEHSVAGKYADPITERSQLEMKLNEQGMTDVHKFLDQSLENYAQGNYEASNAMNRTALEELIKQIAHIISRSKGNEPIPPNRPIPQPVDYRNYLKSKSFLDNSEKDFLDKFYSYASTDGSHPGISSKAEARLRRFVIIAISLLFLEKLGNDTFLNKLT